MYISIYVIYVYINIYVSCSDIYIHVCGPTGMYVYEANHKEQGKYVAVCGVELQGPIGVCVYEKTRWTSETIETSQVFRGYIVVLEAQGEGQHCHTGRRLQGIFCWCNSNENQRKIEHTTEAYRFGAQIAAHVLCFQAGTWKETNNSNVMSHWGQAPNVIPHWRWKKNGIY